MKTIWAVMAVLGIAVTGAGAQAPAKTVDLFQTKCVICHGADGGAATAAGKALQVPAFNAPPVEQASDADLIATISKGKGKMPAFASQLSPAQIKDLVAYVRELGARLKK
jgi:cytochrome c6